ncbi:MAG: hypothetical protein LBU28_07650, partial [Spirochaetaceae bacterium]|nr:hypothetical protein [Spirochaetaceae bacterium]
KNVLKNIGLKNMTITFVAEAYPRKLIVSLKETFGYEVTEQWRGDVAQKGRYYPSLRRPLFRVRHIPRFHDLGGKPLPDYPSDVSPYAFTYRTR